MSKNGKPDFWDWIGIQKKTDYTQLPAWVGHGVGFAVVMVGIVFIVAALSTFVLLLRAVFSQDLATTPTAEDIRNFGLAAGAVIGVPFLIWRSVVAQKQVDVAEQGHITDRINKAVEGLGAEKTVKRNSDETTEPNLEVRIGALYALERISQDSARDHIQIMEILCAYIRQNADRNSPPLPEEDLTPKQWREWGEANRTHPPLDVDIALRIIERRSDERKQREKQANYRLGLERAPFHTLDLSRRDLTNAILANAQIQGAHLRFAKLQGADLRGAQLQGASLGNAELQGAFLVYAKLQGANLGNAELQGAFLGGAKLQGANLGGAKLQGANLGGAKLLGADLGGAELQGADLEFAELQGADLGFAELQGANLGFAELQEADLGFAKLQGANLGSAELQGAYLESAEFDKSTQTQAANFSASACVQVNFTDAIITAKQLQTMFGDGSTTLPGGGGPNHPDWPAHWPKVELEWDDFQTAWRAWQAKIGFQPD